MVGLIIIFALVAFILLAQRGTRRRRASAGWSVPFADTWNSHSDGGAGSHHHGGDGGGGGHHGGGCGGGNSCSGGSSCGGGGCGGGGSS